MYKLLLPLQAVYVQLNEESPWSVKGELTYGTRMILLNPNLARSVTKKKIKCTVNQGLCEMAQ